MIVYAVNATFCVSLAVNALEITGAEGALIVNTKTAFPVPPTLVALIVTLVVPAAVGVPEIVQRVPSTDSPAGKVPDVTAHGTVRGEKSALKVVVGIVIEVPT